MTMDLNNVEPMTREEAEQSAKRCLRCGAELPEKAPLCMDCANDLLGVTDGTVWQ